MLSEGRGTTRPFEIVGAPWVDGERLSESMNAQGLPGVHCRPVTFEPTFQKHAHATCGGCQIHVVDRRAFGPVLTAVALLAECHRLVPRAFAWRPPPYEYEHERMPIDILYGSDALRAQIEAGVPAREIAAGWDAHGRQFENLRGQSFLY